MTQHPPPSRVDDIKPGEFFTEKLNAFQAEIAKWQKGNSNRPLGDSVYQVLQQSKAKAASAGEEKQGEEDGETAVGSFKLNEEDAKAVLEEYLEKKDFDVFSVDDIYAVQETGEPLFAHFVFEDWALLNLRFELHLLICSFSVDCGDSGRPSGIPVGDLSLYYSKYYKKELSLADFGVDNMEELLAMVSDIIVMNGEEKLLESMVPGPTGDFGIFVKLTEEARRDRQCRVDSGHTAAVLNFPKPIVVLEAPLTTFSKTGFSKAPPRARIFIPELKKWVTTNNLDDEQFERLHGRPRAMTEPKWTGKEVLLSATELASIPTTGSVNLRLPIGATAGYRAMDYNPIYSERAAIGSRLYSV